MAFHRTANSVLTVCLSSGGHPSLLLVYRNTSPKKIIGIRFGVSFTDSLGDFNESVYDYDAQASLKPGKKTNSEWEDGVYVGQIQKVKARVWLKKIKFEDGTTFTDDGKKACLWDQK